MARKKKSEGPFKQLSFLPEESASADPAVGENRVCEPTRHPASTADSSSPPNSPALPPVSEASPPRAPTPSPQFGSPTDSDLTGQTVVVLDSHSLIYQVFHAIADMTSPSGRPVNALYGFTRDVLDILAKWRPDYLWAAFDFSDTTFRNELYGEYKAHRDPMPVDLKSQIPEIQRLLTALNIPILSLPGFEADDILATVARQVSERGGRCILVTSDKDCRQLITDQVALLNLRKGQLYGAPQLLEDWGIRPEQVVDFQAMVGDSVDNVPGIASIGPKTATQLLEEFGSLEGVLANLSKIKGKKAEKIAEGAEMARLSQRLVRLDDQVPMTLDWSCARVGGMDVAAAVALCEEAGFRSLTDRVQALAPLATPVTWVADYQTCDSLDRWEEVTAEILQAGVLAFDTETTSTMPRWAELVGVSMAWAPGRAIYIPVRAPAGSRVVPEADLVAALRPLLANPNLLVVGQNLKYDMVVLQSLGVEIAGPLFDTMVADYLLNPGRNVHNMDDLALRYLQHRTIKITELIGKGKNQKLMSDVPVPDITQYAAEDADVPLRLYPLLKAQLQQAGLTDLFESLEMPLVRVLAEMEFAGIHVDVDYLRKLSLEFRQRADELAVEIQRLAGGPFNLDSPKQLAEVLFERLQLPVVKKTKLARSTDADVLEELAPLHPLPQAMLNYRQLTKLQTTYTDALVEQVFPRTGRVHTSFQQDVARTGRLSSKDPNLQNIPIRSEEGRRIRQAFTATNGERSLISADYSQIELRILAHFCGDQELIRAFENNEDIHSVVAAQVHQVSLEDVTSEMRRQAKAINFGIIYGQSPFGLARELGISKGDAATFIEAYFARYPAVQGFMEQVLTDAFRTGEVRTILGRRRPVEGVRDPRVSGGLLNRTMPERVAINTVIQGSAADLIKKAMLEVRELIKTQFPSSQLLLQIHDELVVEAPAQDLIAVAQGIHAAMTQAFSLRVPLNVEVEAGPNWEATQPIDW